MAYLTISSAETAPTCQSRPETAAPITPLFCERMTASTNLHAARRRASFSTMVKVSSGVKRAPCDRGAIPAPVGDGRRERDAGLLLGRGCPPPAGRGRGGGVEDDRRGRSDRGCGGRVDAARLRRRLAGGGAATRGSRARGAARRAGLDR